jgi:hypothetical protein
MHTPIIVGGVFFAKNYVSTLKPFKFSAGAEKPGSPSIRVDYIRGEAPTVAVSKAHRLKICRLGLWRIPYNVVMNMY